MKSIILITQKRNSDIDSRNKKNRTTISNVAHWLITQYKIYIKKDKPQ